MVGGNMRIGILCPWFGPQCKGGAESQAAEMARRFVLRGHEVVILTTCSRDFLDDWEHPAFPPGFVRESGITTGRFLCDSRNSVVFEQANEYLLGIAADSVGSDAELLEEAHAAAFCAESIRSKGMLRWLNRHIDSFDAIIAMPYLYGVVVDALLAFPDRLYVQPCLHRESYALIPRVQEALLMARGILWNSRGEQIFGEELLGAMTRGRSFLVGEGIDFTGLLPAAPMRAPHGCHEATRFVLVLGRRDATKNTDFICRSFASYRRSHPDSGLSLILAGPGQMDYSDASSGILDLGLVDEFEKHWLLRNCQVLANPSVMESYSRVIMESWHCGRPVAVHADCAATATAVEESGGGWTLGSESNWRDFFASLDRGEFDLNESAAMGSSYVQEFADWDACLDRYESVFQDGVEGVAYAPVAGVVHQLLTGFSYKDAVSESAINIRSYLRSRGLQSDIFAQYVDPAAAGNVYSLDEMIGHSEAVLIYHHSIGSEASRRAILYPGPKLLLYHNVTPPQLIESTNPALAAECRLGLEQLPDVIETFSRLFAVSEFNCRDLDTIAGRAGVAERLPLVIDDHKWRVPLDRSVIRSLFRGNKKNLVFVGRINPNKRQDRLVCLVELLARRGLAVSLHLVGGYEPGDKYYRDLVQRIEASPLRADIFLTGKAPVSSLASYFTASDLYVSLSEHEGFGVPLIEAMLFGLPVVALGHAAVPDTVGSAGCIINPDATDDQIADQIAALLVNDERLDEYRVQGYAIAHQYMRKQVFNVYDQKLLPAIQELQNQTKKDPGPEATAKTKIGVVSPRCGVEVNGGAEYHALRLAEELSRAFPGLNVEVLTTCALDYMTWSNHYSPGVEIVRGVTVRRFLVDRERDVDGFNALSDDLSSRLDTASDEEEEMWRAAQGPQSTDLLNYVRDHAHEFKSFIFIPYLYWTTSEIMPLVGDRAWFIPAAHDEWCLGFRFWEKVFSAPCGFLFNTESERSLLARRFEGMTLHGPVLGAGVDEPRNVDIDTFRKRMGINGRYLVYVGRIDPSKGCDELLDLFSRYRQGGGKLELVFIGKEMMQIPSLQGIHALGFVEEADKWSAIAGAESLVNPSPNESLSLVLLEAWRVGTPVLVSRRCEVLVRQVERFGFGLVYGDHVEFDQALKTIESGAVPGNAGETKALVEAEYGWSRIARAVAAELDIN